MAHLIPRSAVAGAIGNTVEWFDFAVYGYFAKEIGEAIWLIAPRQCRRRGAPPWCGPMDRALLRRSPRD